MNIEHWITVGSSFGSAVIGALTGGLFAIWAGQQAHKNSLRLDRVQGQKKINGILEAIHCEISILAEVYAQSAGQVLEQLKDGEPFDLHFSLTEKYFIVYPSNTEVVGQIDDPDLVKSIVVTYNKANVLIESFRMNNWYKERIQHIWETTPLQPAHRDEEMHPTELSILKKRMIEHVGLLKRAHQDLGQETVRLLKRIDGYRQRHGNLEA